MSICNMVVPYCSSYFYFLALTSILVDFNDTSSLGSSSTCSLPFFSTRREDRMISSANACGCKDLLSF